MTGAKNENEEITSLGSYFKTARESRGESLEHVSAITRIGKNYLQAIEEDRLEKILSPAYAKGFIRLYANHLGLSAAEMMPAIGSNGRQETQAPEISIREINTGRGSSVSAPRSGFKKWGLPLFLLIILSIFALLPDRKQGNNNIPGQKPLPPSTEPVVAPSGTPPLTQQPASDAKPADTTPESPAANGAPPAARGIILRLKAVQDGRIHITIDGAISQEYELKTGDIIEWKAETVFLLELDNSGSVEGELNGTRMKVFGEPGKAAHLTIRADSILQ